MVGLGLSVDHVTVWRWVQRYAAELGRRLRRHLCPTNNVWRVDETCVRMKGKWMYLYWALDSCGATIDFLLSAKRDSATAQRFLTKAVGGENPPEAAGIAVSKIVCVSLPPSATLSRQGGYAHTLKGYFTPIWAGP